MRKAERSVAASGAAARRICSSWESDNRMGLSMDGDREMVGRLLLVPMQAKNALVGAAHGGVITSRLERAQEQGLGAAARAVLLRRNPAGGLALARIVSDDREEALLPAGALIVYDPLIDDGRTAPHGEVDDALAISRTGRCLSDPGRADTTCPSKLGNQHFPPCRPCRPMSPMYGGQTGKHLLGVSISDSDPISDIGCALRQWF